MKIAALDVGTNSIHLLIARVAADGQVEPLDRAKEMVRLGGFFGGESMFNRRTDASKAAVMHLIERLRACGFVLCDGQVPTPHLQRLGAIDIPRKEYLQRLAAALEVDARPLSGSPSSK